MTIPCILSTVRECDMQHELKVIEVNGMWMLRLAVKLYDVRQNLEGICLSQNIIHPRHPGKHFVVQRNMRSNRDRYII